MVMPFKSARRAEARFYTQYITLRHARELVNQADVFFGGEMTGDS
jgi:hypothetical protein